jgi:molybdenum cofactor cytidylyltransferase
LVVVRPDDPVAKALARRPVRLLVNPDPEGDMLSSVRCGLRVLPEDCQAVLVALGDQPAITAGLVEEMCRAFWQSGRGILTPVHRGRRGHPLLFSRRYVPELLQAHQGVGLRGLLQAHPEDIFELPVPTPEILEDLDTPEDYLRAGRRAEEPRG